MKSQIISIAATFTFLFLLISCSAKAAQMVNSNGITRIESAFGTTHIVAIIRTKQLNIGKSTDKVPRNPENSCTYSRYPCSEVVNLSIIVNGKKLFVPRSSYCDWSDLNSVTLARSKQQFVITVSGGDAAESFTSKIYFDSEMVERRLIKIPYDNNEITEKTIYYRESDSGL